MGCGHSASRPVAKLDNYLVNDDPLTQDEKAILKKTWPLVQQHYTTVGLEVFARFFKEHPNYQQLFPEFRTINKDQLTDSKPLLGHSRRIMKAIDNAVISLDDFETFEVYLVDLGRRHQQRQLAEQHLEHMRLAFVDTLQHRLTNIWTKEMSLGWNKLFRSISRSMMQGVNEKDPLILEHNDGQGSQVEILSS